MRPGDQVWVFRWWDRVPVFHRTTDYRTEPRKSTFERDGRTWDRSERLSFCGAVIYTVETWGQWPWRDGAGEWNNTTNGHGLRLEHAQMIGRPCKVCFPELAGR